MDVICTLSVRCSDVNTPDSSLACLITKATNNTGKQQNQESLMRSGCRGEKSFSIALISHSGRCFDIS